MAGFNLRNTWTKRVLGMTFGYLFGAAVLADEAPVLMVTNAYATPTFPMAKMGAGYFTLHNTGQEDVEIVAVAIDSDIANKVELHETFLQADMAKMRQLPMPFSIAAGQTVEFAPRGKHLMLMGLQTPLEVDMEFSLTLDFASGDRQPIIFKVQKQAKKDGEGGHHRHH